MVLKQTLFQFKKLIDASKDPRFGNTHALILFETVQDALRAIEGGVPIKELNVGSMAHSLVKQWLTTFCLWTKMMLLASKNCVTLALNSTSVRYQMILRKICSTLSKKLTFNNLHSDKLVDNLS